MEEKEPKATGNIIWVFLFCVLLSAFLLGRWMAPKPSEIDFVNCSGNEAKINFNDGTSIYKDLIQCEKDNQITVQDIWDWRDSKLQDAKNICAKHKGEFIESGKIGKVLDFTGCKVGNEAYEYKNHSLLYESQKELK